MAVEEGGRAEPDDEGCPESRQWAGRGSCQSIREDEGNAGIDRTAERDRPDIWQAVPIGRDAGAEPAQDTGRPVADEEERRPQDRRAARAVVDRVPGRVALVDETFLELCEPRRIARIEALVVVREVEVVVEVDR